MNGANRVNITADPIGLEGGVNLFGYVDDDPVNWVDPTGESPAVILAGIGVGIVTVGIINWAIDIMKPKKAEEVICGGKKEPPVRLPPIDINKPHSTHNDYKYGQRTRAPIYQPYQPKR